MNIEHYKKGEKKMRNDELSQEEYYAGLGLDKNGKPKGPNKLVEIPRGLVVIKRTKAELLEIERKLLTDPNFTRE